MAKRTLRDGYKIMKNNHRGFVLIMTLTMISVLFIAVSFFSKWIENEVLFKNERSETYQQIIDKYNTLSTIIYMVSTRPTTYSGIAFPQRVDNSYPLPIDSEENMIRNAMGNELKLDDSLYQGIGSVLFSLQDDYGLISVNELTPKQISKLLDNDSNSSIDNQQRRLYPILRDYIDRDSHLRQDGAESTQYLQKGIIPPANHPLRTPEELMKVLEWKQLFPEKTFQKYQGHLTSTPNVTINLNTASREVMKIHGLSQQSIDKVIAFRQTQSININTVQKLLAPTELQNDGDNYLYFPSRSIRISLLSGPTGQIDQLYFSFAWVNEQSQPWLIRYKKTSVSSPKNHEHVNPTGQTLFDK